MAIERYLHDLLFEHDCVVVPDFGGFLTHYRPARLDLQRRLVHPPSKDLSFNRKLVRQDGLLEDLVMRREGTDFNTAKARVEEERRRWWRQLEQDGRLELQRVGTFFRDAEGNLQFEPDRRVNFLKDAFGLRSVEAVPVPITVVPAPSAVPAVEKEPVGEGRNRAWYLAAAAMAAIAVTAATWYVIGLSPKALPVAEGFDLFRGTDLARYRMPEAPAMAMAPWDALVWSPPNDGQGVQQLPIAGPDAPLVAVNLGQAPSKAIPESTAVATPSPTARFHIIGGCFLEKENADRFVAELQAKGFAAALIDRKGGLYRVAYGSYPQLAMALEALAAVRKEIAPEAWLLAK